MKGTGFGPCLFFTALISWNADWALAGTSIRAMKTSETS
jgi:hypothetical protein